MIDKKDVLKMNMAYLFCKIRPDDNTEEIVSANEKCLLLFECDSLSELKSYFAGSFMNAVYEDDKKRVHYRKDKLNVDKFAMQHVIYRIVTSKGDIRWVEGYVNLNESDDGIGYHMFINDITENISNVSVTADIEKAVQEYDFEYGNTHNWNKLVNLLSEPYHLVVRLDLDTGAVIPVSYNDFMGNDMELESVERLKNLDGLKEYLSYGMDIEEYSRLEETLDFDNIRIALWDEGRFVRTFKWHGMTGDQYYDLKVSGVDEAPYSHIVIGVIDVTERKLIEIENRKNSRMVEALSDDYIAIFFAEAKTGKLRIYRAAGEITERYGALLNGQTRYQEIIHTYVEKYVKISKDDNIHKYLEFDAFMEDVNKKGVVSFIYTRMLKNGSRQYRVKAVKIEENGEFLGVVLGFCDVEDEYRKDKETQALLRDALEEAKHASASKSNFLFNMSHDIRTPMNAILGFASLAKKEVDDPEKLVDYLSKIEVSGQHLLELINDVLDMARIESGRVELHETTLDIEELFAETVDMFKIDMGKKGITFTYSLEATDTIVEADGLRLKQIALNLIGNSIKYTNEGGEIFFGARQIPSDKAGLVTYEICVRDTGIGMSEEFQRHLFDLFERENRRSVHGIQGTGLGLAITKRLTELMNGNITCKSKVDEGTEFKCTVKLKVSDAENIETDDDNIDISLLTGKKVLLVEDNDLNREIARTVLEEAGLIVEEATDGTIAVEMLGDKNVKYDVVLMDIQMPYMDGYKATRIIRNMELRTKNHIPIIAMTANAFEEDKKKALEAGMDAHIAKPVDVTELYREMIHFLR